VLGATVMIAWLAPLVDAVFRRGWEDVRVAAHAEAAFTIYGLVGTLLGFVLALGVVVSRALSMVVAKRAPRWSQHVAPAIAALAAVAATAKTAFWTFTGHGVEGTAVARFGPYVLLFAAAAGAAVAARLTLWAVREADAGRAVGPLVVSATAFVGSILAIVLDLTVYVSLYSSLHTVVEVVAGLCLLCAVMPGIAWLGNRAPVLRFGVAAASAAVGLLVSVLYVSSNSVRTWAEDGLRHVWREPVYVGRMLSRVQVAESYLRDPGAFNDTTTNSILRLRQRYDLATTTRGMVLSQKGFNASANRCMRLR
jgi:hypothetical protein